MDISSAAGSILGAFGLSGAAGLNAWIPLFVTALLDRLDVIHLAAPYDRLSTTAGLIVLGALTVADLVGDKVPAVDHALHAAGTVIAPIAGAVLFTGSAGQGADLPTIVTAVLGGGTAGALHLTRSAVRPLSTATTGGLGNPVLSLIEDVASIGLTVLALALPVLGLLALVAIVAALVVAWRRMRRRRVAQPAS
ncbi:MAG: DUF4126 domain-containing protein [Solirubrobacteraceae bacterium]